MAKTNSNKKKENPEVEEVLQTPDLLKAELKGNVRQVKQICYKAYKGRLGAEKGKIEQSNFHSQTFKAFYDEKGNKTEEKIYYTGKYFQHKLYNGNKEPMEETSGMIDGEEGNKVTREFNEQGLMTEQCHYDAKGNKQSGSYRKYDAKGNIIEGGSYKGDRIMTTKYTTRYNDAGRELESTSWAENGTESATLRTYDDKGNEIEVSASSNGVLGYHQTKEYEYDADGNMRGYTATNHVKPEASAAKTVCKCNSYGDVIQADHYKDDGSLQESRTIEYEYDADGKKIVPVYGEKPAKLKSQTEETENDAHGNWIKKTTYYVSPDKSWNKIPINLYVREITYWGEEASSPQADELFFADIFTAKDEDTDDEEKKSPLEDLSEEQLKWLSEPANINEPFPIFRYYVLTNKEMPSILNYSGPYIEAHALLEELKTNLNAKVIYSTNSIWHQQNEVLSRYILSFPDHPGFILNAPQLSSQAVDEFEIPDFIDESTGCIESGYIYFSGMQLFRPSEASGKIGEYEDEHDFARQIEDYITKCSLRKKPEQPTIHMIEVNGNGFSMVEHAVNDDFEIKDLDVNYGYGFNKFHTDLMSRILTGTKGLVLFHGQPGTGKTYYIRHLLKKMSTSKKIVIYMPPNMVDHLTEPSFMTFLSSSVRDWSEEGHFCVLLIEDAEPLLAKRQEGIRIQGVTNLLNMTDGLLNDMLNLQIICTFNVDLKKLDSALLREGRLIARKEFKALSVLDANLLAQRLGIKHQFTKPATLAQIYAKRKNQNTLIHDVEQERDASTPIDDL